MQSKRRWLPGWQRAELVCLCLDRGMSRREAASWRRVSVSTVQYWVGRYRAATDAERASGAWAQDRPSTPRRQPGRVSETVHDRVCETVAAWLGGRGWHVEGIVPSPITGPEGNVEFLIAAKKARSSGTL